MEAPGGFAVDEKIFELYSEKKSGSSLAVKRTMVPVIRSLLGCFRLG